jgi:hypothetical protein
MQRNGSRQDIQPFRTRKLAAPDGLLRRLRSAFALFADRIVTLPSLQEELKWIAGELGWTRRSENLRRRLCPSGIGNS